MGAKGSRLVESLVTGPGPSPDPHVRLQAANQTCSGRDGPKSKGFLPLQGLRKSCLGKKPGVVPGGPLIPVILGMKGQCRDLRRGILQPVLEDR